MKNDTAQKERTKAKVEDCPHGKRMLIKESHYKDPPGAEQISICLGCGTIRILGHRDFFPIDIEFRLSARQLEAAARGVKGG